jgi:hypothetical protein
VNKETDRVDAMQKEIAELCKLEAQEPMACGHPKSCWVPALCPENLQDDKWRRIDQQPVIMECSACEREKTLEKMFTERTLALKAIHEEHEKAVVDAERMKWENLEASVCPEDMGFVEHIRNLEMLLRNRKDWEKAAVEKAVAVMVERCAVSEGNRRLTRFQVVIQIGRVGLGMPSVPSHPTHTMSSGRN